MIYYANAGEIERKWYVIDAAGKPLGRVAAQAAVCCAASTRSPSPPTWTAAISSSSSTQGAVLTGKKLEKKYTRHTGWIGGLKEPSTTP